jgi:hypothetical protein
LHTDHLIAAIRYSKDLSNIISDICHKNTKSTIWIGGDLNLPDINWSSNTITSNQYRKEISEICLALEEDLGLIQSVNFPTRGQNLLDVFFTNRPSLINRCEAIPGISDHEIVFVDSNIAISRQRPVKRKIYMWKKADTQKLKSKIEEMSNNILEKFKINTNINTLWDYFKTKCTDIMEKCIPSKTTSTRITQPWITKDMRTLVKTETKTIQSSKTHPQNKGLELIQCNKETRSKEMQGGI